MKLISIVIVILAFSDLGLAADSCGTCQTSNEVLCLNQTSYQLCMNDRPLNGVQHCPSGQVCSDVDDICVDETTPGVNDVCGSGSSSCGNCPTGTKYTCVSRTQFARCVGGSAASNMVQSCDTNEVCVQALLTQVGNICAPQCVVDFYSSSPDFTICPNENFETTTTTVAPPATPSLDDLRTACTNGRPASSSSGYFYVLNPSDAECKSYVYCEEISSVMYAIVMSCRSDQYFNSETRKCQSTQPTNCGSSSTTTTSTPTDSTSTSTDSTSTATDSTSTATDSTSTATDSTSTATDSTSTATDSTSTSTDSTSTATDSTSTATDSTSTSTDSTSTATDSTSTATDSTSTATDSTSTSTDSTSTSTDSTSTATDSTSTSTDSTSTATDSTSTATDSTSSSATQSSSTTPANQS